MTTPALQLFIDTINATGGLVALEDGSYAPQVDPEWLDLAHAYLAACSEQGIPPVIEPCESDTND